MSDCQFPKQCGFPGCFCTGQYRGTVEFYAEIYAVDEEYEEYLDTLSRAELDEERERITAQYNALDEIEFDH